MQNKKNILIIPADNRPVSYTLPESIGSINNGINIFMPPREFFGGLKTIANIEKILEWTQKTVSENRIDYIICALDTIVYGGLISSRWCKDTQEDILSRIKSFKSLIEQSSCKFFGFSSIMRISDSNVNEEEKDYWDKYGKLIFKYSYLKHKTDINPDNAELLKDLQDIKDQIPLEILEDYLQTRQRNFLINKTYLKWLEEDFFDFFVFAKDDTAPFGLNVQEAGLLEKEISEKKLANKAIIHTGSDEVNSILLAGALKDNFKREISIFPIYSTIEGPQTIPRYEDQHLYKSVKKHLEICGIKLAETEEASDITLLLHTFKKNQNDFALQEFVEPKNTDSVEVCLNLLRNSGKPVILADVCCANGSDKLLIEKMFSEITDFSKLYGYAGWNTASNTIGTALSTGISRYIAEKENNFSQENFNRVIFVRFVDDWAYQAIARQKIRSVTDKADKNLLNKELLPLIQQISSKFDINSAEISLNFPWERTFEVETRFMPDYN